MRKWHMETRPTSYPDLKEYIVLEPNPDAGKEGVSYAGKDLRICILDNKESALVVTAAPEMLAALKVIEPLLAESARQLGNTSAWPILTQVRAAIAKAEGVPEAAHVHVGVGYCPICKHYGEDCTGEKP